MNASTTETLFPLKVVQVIEKEHGVSRSRFMAMRPAAVKQPANARCLNDMIPVAFTFDCETDDSECCTKALRLVSGSDSAIHPRAWPEGLHTSLKSVFTSILYWELTDNVIDSSASELSFGDDD
jgi:hypothetical protein